mgnify:FL=1
MELSIVSEEPSGLSVVSEEPTGETRSRIGSQLMRQPKALYGVVETLTQMGTGLAGALPAAAAGVYSAATGGEYAPAFKAVQDFYTYEPRTEQGKAFSGLVGDIFEKYSGGVDVVAEATPGGPLAQTAVKTLGEAIPLVAPFTPRIVSGMRRTAKAAEPVAPVEVARPEVPASGELKPLIIVREEAAKPAEVVRPEPIVPAEIAKPVEAVKPAEFTFERAADQATARGQMELPTATGNRGSTLYSGIPIEEVGKAVEFAERNLKDALGVPEKGVTVLPEPLAKKPGFLTSFRSPSKVAEKFPEFAPIRKRGELAVLEQDTLRSVFARRLASVDLALGGGWKRVKDLGKTYRENKRSLNEILLEGDMIGKRFTPGELTARGAPKEVITAYNSLRSAYDHALTIANATRDLRGKVPVNYREGYVPHFFHNYFVLGDGVMLSSAKTLREAISMGNDAARGGSEVKIVPKRFEFPQEAQQSAVIGDIAYFKMKEAIEKSFEMTPDQAQALVDGIVRMKGRSRFVGNFLQRKGVPGWEQNLDWSHRHYFNMISRYAALDKFKSNSISYFERKFGAFDKDHTGIAKYAKDYINDVNGVPSKAENLLNSTIANAPILNKFIAKHLGDRPALQIASATTNAVAIAKLGLYNVSAALVNGTQLLMANALLGERWTAIGAAHAGRVTAELVKRKVGFGGITNPDIGILRKLDVDIQQGLESGAGYSKFNQVGRLFKTSTAFFQKVEFELRATTGLGAYYKALSEGKSKADALTYAKEINRRVNFDYSIADTPDFIRRSGPIGQVAFQFKKFPIKTMEFMGSLKGIENVRFWVPYAVIAGYYGFPGMEAIKNIIKGLTGQDLELATKGHLMEWAGDDKEKQAIAKTIFYGAFSNEELGGIDLSHRVGGGDFIPSKTSDLFGPGFSSVVRATQMATSEHWVEALREISTAPGNIAIALRNDGEITSPWQRDRLTIKLDTKGRILKGLGFATTKESIERDVSRTMTYREGKQRKDEQDAIDAFIKADKEGDDKALDKAIERFAELGMGRGTGKRIKEEMSKKETEKSMRTFESLSRKGKARQLDVLDFVAP